MAQRLRKGGVSDSTKRALVQVCLVDETTGEPIQIFEGMVFGRDEGDWKLTGDKLVSRRHCELTLDQTGQLYCRDLGSSNGTFLNGRRLTSGKEYAFYPGDVLEIGNHRLVLSRLAAISSKPRNLKAVSRPELPPDLQKGAPHLFSPRTWNGPFRIALCGYGVWNSILLLGSIQEAAAGAPYSQGHMNLLVAVRMSVVSFTGFVLLFHLVAKKRQWFAYLGWGTLAFFLYVASDATIRQFTGFRYKEFSNRFASLCEKPSEKACQAFIKKQIPNYRDDFRLRELLPYIPESRRDEVRGLLRP